MMDNQPGIILLFLTGFTWNNICLKSFEQVFLFFSSSFTDERRKEADCSIDSSLSSTDSTTPFILPPKDTWTSRAEPEGNLLLPSGKSLRIQPFS